MAWYDFISDIGDTIGDAAGSVYDWGAGLFDSGAEAAGAGLDSSWMLDMLPTDLGQSASDWGSYLTEGAGDLSWLPGGDMAGAAYGALLPEVTQWASYLDQQPQASGVFKTASDWLNRNEKNMKLAMTMAGLAQGLFGGDRKLSPLQQQQQALNMARMQAQMRQLEANRALPQYQAQRTLYNPQVTARYGRGQQPAEARFLDTSVIEKARGGRLLNGPTGGQDDVVPILGSHGEYMIDASTVSDLGDGNNAAGAHKLDQLVRNVRQHKRGRKTLPPRAKSPLEYMV